jgi:hypothetical protein
VASMTGAALMPRSVRSAVASCTVAVACNDTGLSDIKSTALTASNVNRGPTGLMVLGIGYLRSEL